MKIYHYTYIETLALILKNKKIRFNRLDKVDDVEEGSVESSGIQFCKYVFVSCWTENPEESIPLWKLYTNGTNGVRISLEREMFQEYLVSDLDFGGKEAKGFIKTITPPCEMKNPDYLVLPIKFDYENDLFYRRINYVDDVYQFTKNAINIEPAGEGKYNFGIQMKPFGYYKNSRWRFQEESRFVLYIYPFNIFSLRGDNKDWASIAASSFCQNKSLPFTYYDIGLKNEVFDELEITLSPSATEAQQLIVQSLIDKYAPKACVKESRLGQLVRLK